MTMRLDMTTHPDIGIEAIGATGAATGIGAATKSLSTGRRYPGA
jgi:hypothetical protein